mgnify:CR=1 FL=1
MPNTNYLTGGVLSAKLDTVGVDPVHAVGVRCEGNNASEWMYVGPATAVINQYDVIWINQTFVPAQITSDLADTNGFVGFAQVAFATSDYGWVMLSGKPTINTIASTVKDVHLFTCATAGFLDDATASGSTIQILGVSLVTTTAATAGVAIAAFPVARRPGAGT